MIHVLTVGHVRFDTRIWIKEISSLVRAGYKIRYHVADGGGDEVKSGVEIIDYGAIPPGSGVVFRFKKMFQVMTQSGLKRGDWVHFHDGIFLPFALLLAFRGCKVIYDVHEDFPRQVLNFRFNRFIKRAMSSSLSLLEWLGSKLFFQIIAATPAIARRFPKNKTILVQNFPLSQELVSSNRADADIVQSDRKYIAYVGGLSKHRGALEMLRALELVNQKYPLTLLFGGEITPSSLRAELIKSGGWKFVEELGFISREKFSEVLAKSELGLVLFHPSPNHTEAQPNKMFEYMSSGTPILASNFPMWANIVEGAGCGVLSDPLNPEDIADSITWVLEHPTESKLMGVRAREAVLKTYNWDVEKAKLLDFYNASVIN